MIDYEFIKAAHEAKAKVLALRPNAVHKGDFRVSAIMDGDICLGTGWAEEDAWINTAYTLEAA